MQTTRLLKIIKFTLKAVTKQSYSEKKIINMKQLLRSQMRNVFGGLNISEEVSENCPCKKGEAKSGETCSITTAECSRKWGCGLKCEDQGSELGSKCK